MSHSTVAKLGTALGMVALLLAVPLLGTTSAAPMQSCYGYTATTLAVSPTSVVPGGSITLSGLGVPGETVSATLLSSPTAALGSGVVNGGGSFSFGSTVPLGTAPGTYTIQGTSTSCSSFVVSLTVTAPPPMVLAAVVTTPPAPATSAPTTVPATTTTTPNAALSGCAASAAARTFIPGQQVLWTLNGNGFDTTKQVRLRLRSGNNFTLLYGFGAWPSGDQVTLTIPTDVAPGAYSMEQVGYKLADGKASAANCAVTISAAPEPASATRPGERVPFAVIAIAAVTLGGLLQLRLRRQRRAA